MKTNKSNNRNSVIERRMIKGAGLPFGTCLAFGFSLIVIMLLAACSSDDDANPAKTTTASIVTFEGMEEKGSSTLTRTDGRISYDLSTTGLEPGTANTLWVVIFNRPEYCDGDCDDADLANPDVMADVVFGGSGQVVGSSGEATFSGSRKVGDNSGSILGEWMDLPENGLMDPRGAEIHFVIRNHGPVIEGLEQEMISTFNAGCGPVAMEGAPDVPETLGTYGDNTCVDTQFAVHQP